MFGSMLRNIAPQIRQAVQQQPQQQALMPMQGGGGFFGGAIGGIAPQIAQGIQRQQQQEYPTTPSITTLPPPQPGGGMRVGYDIINSPAVPGQQPRGFAALGPAIGSALGGMGAGFGGMPAPMQNPFLGGQGMSAAQMNPQQYQAAPVPNADSLRQALGIPSDPGLTPYKLGQTLGGQPQFIPDAPLPEGMVGTTGGNGFDPVTGRIDLGTAGGSGYYVPQGQRQQPTSRLLQSVQQQQMQQQQPTRSINPIAQRMAQKIQARQPQPAQGIGTGIASLINRGMMF